MKNLIIVILVCIVALLAYKVSQQPNRISHTQTSEGVVSHNSDEIRSIADLKNLLKNANERKILDGLNKLKMSKYNHEIIDFISNDFTNHNTLITTSLSNILLQAKRNNFSIGAPILKEIELLSIKNIIDYSDDNYNRHLIIETMHNMSLIDSSSSYEALNSFIQKTNNDSFFKIALSSIGTMCKQFDVDFFSETTASKFNRRKHQIWLEVVKKLPKYREISC